MSTTSAKAFSWRKHLRWLPGVIISVVALFMVFKLATWEDIGLAFKAVKPLNMVIIVVLTIIALGTRAFAWKALLKNETSFSNSFFVINEGYLLNNLFPFRAGEFGRAIVMGQSTKLGPYHVLSTIVMERVIDVAMAAGLLLSTVPLAMGMEWAKSLAIVALIIVFVGLILLYLLARNSKKVKTWVKEHFGKWKFVNNILLPRFESLLDGFSALNNPSLFLQSIFWLFLSWCLWVLVYYTGLVSISPGAPLWWAAFVDGVLAMGVAIPSAPAALGVFEAALVGAIALLNAADYTSALAFAILMHFMQFAVTGIFGGIGLIKEGRSLSNLFADIQKQK